MSKTETENCIDGHQVEHDDLFAENQSLLKIAAAAKAHG